MHVSEVKVKLDAWRHVPARWLIVSHVLVLESRDVFNALRGLGECRSRRRRCKWGHEATWPLCHVTWPSARAMYLKTHTRTHTRIRVDVLH